MAKRNRQPKPTSVTGGILSPKPLPPDPTIVENSFAAASRAIESSTNQIHSSIIQPINQAIETVKSSHYRLSQPILDPIIKARSSIDNALSKIHDAMISPLMKGFVSLQPFGTPETINQSKLDPSITVYPEPIIEQPVTLPGTTYNPDQPPPSTGFAPPQPVVGGGSVSTNLQTPVMRTSETPVSGSGGLSLPAGDVLSPAGSSIPPHAAGSLGNDPAAKNIDGGQAVPANLMGSCPDGSDPLELTHTGDQQNGDWIWSYPDGTIAEVTGSYGFPVRLFKCKPVDGSILPINPVNPNNPPQSNQPLGCIPLCQPVQPVCATSTPTTPTKPSKPAKPSKPGEPLNPDQPQQPPNDGTFPTFAFDGCDTSNWGNEKWQPCCSDVSTTDVQGTSITTYLEQVVSWFTNAVEQSGLPFADSIGQNLSAILTPLVDTFATLLSGIGLDSGAQGALVLERMILGLVNRHTGGGLREASDRVDYAINATYPHVLPSAESGVAGYITGIYSYDTCSCIWGFNGRYKGYLDPTIEMERRRTSVEESLILYRKGLIDDVELADRIRRNGWIRESDVEELKLLYTEIPGISQLISYMVRDVADADVVTKFGLDTDFEAKYTGQVKEFAEQQGIHPDYAKLAWRSHWTIPPPSTLYEILHRLRNNPDFGGSDQVLSDVKEALKQQDILPFWIDRLLEISYHPINRIDAQRGYEFGAFNDQDLIDAYNAQGYTDTITDKLVQAAKLRVIDKLKTNPFMKAYASGWINSDELQSSLGSIGYPQDIIDQLKERALLYENLEVRKALIQGIIDNFVKGGSDEQTLQDQLSNNGLDPDQIEFTIQMALGRRQSQVKHIPGSEWIKWLVSGNVDSSDATDALLRLGYNWDDIHRMISAAMEDSRQKQQVKEAKKLAAEEKAKEKQYLAEQRLQIQAQKNAQTEKLREERLALRLQNMEYRDQQRSIAYQNKLNAARRAKSKQTAAIRLLQEELIGNVVKKTGVDSQTAETQVNRLISLALSNGHYYKQEAIAGLAHLISIWSTKIGVDYPTFAGAIINMGSLTNQNALEAWQQSPQYQPPSIP